MSEDLFEKEKLAAWTLSEPDTSRFKDVPTYEQLRAELDRYKRALERCREQRDWYRNNLGSRYIEARRFSGPEDEREIQAILDAKEVRIEEEK